MGVEANSLGTACLRGLKNQSARPVSTIEATGRRMQKPALLAESGLLATSLVA